MFHSPTAHCIRSCKRVTGQSKLLKASLSKWHAAFAYLAGTLLRPLSRCTVTTSPSLQVTTMDSGAAAPLLLPVRST